MKLSLSPIPDDFKKTPKVVESHTVNQTMREWAKKVESAIPTKKVKIKRN